MLATYWHQRGLMWVGYVVVFKDETQTPPISFFNKRLARTTFPENPQVVSIRLNPSDPIDPVPLIASLAI